MSELVVECPTCQKKVEWKAENKYRPFCSDRCHLIDGQMKKNGFQR